VVDYYFVIKVVNMIGAQTLLQRPSFATVAARPSKCVRARNVVRVQAADRTLWLPGKRSDPSNAMNHNQ
jgi:hypothetical protein